MICLLIYISFFIYLVVGFTLVAKDYNIGTYLILGPLLVGLLGLIIYGGFLTYLNCPYGK